jgi:hypothetical protein
MFPPWALQKLRKVIDNGVTQPEFPLLWTEKDVLLTLSASGKVSAALPILSEIANVRADAAEDFGSYDLSAVYFTDRPSRAAEPCSEGLRTRCRQRVVASFSLLE